ncbi:sugar ABC transporter substrate-binding protein [Paraburkholderia sp. C35]|uniref:ABC transporter substrate-binding protein n=1 Tax=Paraburkholderia sp. C35 TaxID=2126993 RepID=UPI001EF54EDD|nr:sugar ABC transporter substrate-binding protein [Paraburkholderia sp. C35]
MKFFLHLRQVCSMARTTAMIAGMVATFLAHAGGTEIRYALWDANQRPAYQACAAQFEKENPDIHIRISQVGWEDYWTVLTTQFVSGTAPDVFTNHLMKYPEMVTNGQLVDLTSYIQRDKMETDSFYPALLKNWSREGHQYGLPKDWDTVALVYNKQMFRDAGIDPASISDWTWNDRDGGTFEKAIARLTIDTNGNRGDSKQFDAQHVAVRGYQIARAGGMMGQTEWSTFAVSEGFKYNDGPWSTRYYYDDPRLARTLEWFVSLTKKGYSARFDEASRLGSSALFAAGKTAMVSDGSWMVNWYAQNAKFEVGYAVLPKGPVGRVTMFNGLADSIWSGSEHKEASWRWVKFLASAPCQKIVAQRGVVFPAIQDLDGITIDAHAKRNIDTRAFFDMTKATTFQPPIAKGGAQIDAIMDAAIESILLGQASAATALKEANVKVNEITHAR